jgi:hypothetical protein
VVEELAHPPLVLGQVPAAAAAGGGGERPDLDGAREEEAGFTLPVRATEPPAVGNGLPTGKPRLPLIIEQIQIFKSAPS